jgi:hypothetical protein
MGKGEAHGREAAAIEAQQPAAGEEHHIAGGGVDDRRARHDTQPVVRTVRGEAAAGEA